MRMNPEWKAKWVAALRSGEYQQGTGHLKEETECGTKYCCLGVLGDILDPGGWANDPSRPEIPSFRGAKEMLPHHTLVETGVDGKQWTLADMNDGDMNDGKDTFAQIADWIEENL